jgi:superfamily I DNA and/or RNA helicase
LIKEAEAKILSTHKVIVSTSSGSFAPKIRNLKIANVIIDEATQGMEPETLIPLAFARKVVLLGDQ